MSDKECVQIVAKTDGNHYPPAYYRNEVQRRFSRVVSSSTVTKALGSYHSRLRIDKSAAIAKAKALLSACGHDNYLACHMVSLARAT